MSTALQIMKGVNNAVIAAKTDEELNEVIELAKPEVSAKAFGALYNKALASLAIHDLLVEEASSSATSGGQTVSERQVGKRRVKYGGSTQQSSQNFDPRSDEGLSRTIYGQRFMRLRSQVAVGFVSSGTDF